MKKLAIKCGLSVAIGAASVSGLLPIATAIAQSPRLEIAEVAEVAQATAPASADLPEAEALYQQITALVEQGRYAEAIELGKEALSITEAAYEAGHPRTVVPLNLLAELYRLQGDSAAAVSFYERAIAILDPLLDQGIPDVFNILSRLASLHQEQGNYDLARPLYERALAVREKIFDPDHPDVASSLNSLALLYYELGDYGSALPLLERALSIRETAFGENSAEVADSLNSLATVHERQGDYELALSLYQRSLSIGEATLGANHPEVAAIQSNLATLYSAQGNYELALPLMERALAVSEAALGKDDPQVATSLVNLAELHRLRGDYTAALPLLERALSIDKAAFGESHPRVAGVLNNLGLLYRDQGNYSSALPLLKQAVSIYEAALGPAHTDLARALNGLALVYLDLSNYSAALPLFKRALPIFESTLGENHPNVATLLNNIGGLYQESGDYSAALPFYDRALLVQETALGKNHPDVAASLNNLALLHRDRKDYAAARPLFERALSIRETTLDSNHPYVANSLNNLAGLYQAENKVDRAIELYSRGSAIQEENVSIMISQSSEARRQQYINALSPMISVVVSMNAKDNPDNSAATQLALSTILQRKGRVLDAVANTAEQLRSQLSPENRELLDELNSVRGSIANLRFSGTGGLSRAQYQSEIAQLEERAERIEETLTRGSAEFAIETTPVSIAAVQALIPDEAALVEFVRYRPLDFNQSHNYWGPARYAAYVLTSQGEAQAIDLGEAAPIDRLISQFQAGLSSRATNIKTIGRQLDEQLMSPIRPFLDSKTQLLLSPDSQLTLIPFEALVSEDDRYLIEKYQTSYLTSGRDLIKLQTNSPGQQPPVILANPDYEQAIAAGSAGARPARSVDAASLTFNPLPGTATEAEAIAPLLPQASLYTQDKATETVLKQLNAPSILHIATHGFFLPDVAFVPTAKTSARGPGASLDVVEVESPMSDAPENITASNLENPLLRSGLALAGANTRSRSANDSEDGIFTALEASGLNLHGTQLVVLSACETGVGAASTGEGVYGLRRAFVTAGAESQLMSLWQVDDYGTSELMSLYYENLMNQTQGRGESLRNAQLALMNTGTYAHPYYWSSFIVSGDWRPLD